MKCQAQWFSYHKYTDTYLSGTLKIMKGGRLL